MTRTKATFINGPIEGVFLDLPGDVLTYKIQTSTIIEGDDLEMPVLPIIEHTYFRTEEIRNGFFVFKLKEE